MLTTYNSMNNKFTALTDLCLSDSRVELIKINFEIYLLLHKIMYECNKLIQ